MKNSLVILMLCIFWNCPQSFGSGRGTEDRLREAIEGILQENYPISTAILRGASRGIERGREEIHASRFAETARELSSLGTIVTFEDEVALYTVAAMGPALSGVVSMDTAMEITKAVLNRIPILGTKITLGTLGNVMDAIDSSLASGGHRTTGEWSSASSHRSPSEWLSQGVAPGTGTHRSVEEWLRGEPSRRK